MAIVSQSARDAVPAGKIAMTNGRTTYILDYPQDLKLLLERRADVSDRLPEFVWITDEPGPGEI